jgi:hypothetical protein
MRRAKPFNVLWLQAGGRGGCTMSILERGASGWFEELRGFGASIGPSSATPMRGGLREILTISALFVPASAQAHPGPHRGELLWSLAHAVTQMDHLAAIGVGAALAIAVAWPLTARRHRPSAR